MKRQKARANEMELFGSCERARNWILWKAKMKWRTRRFRELWNINLWLNCSISSFREPPKKVSSRSQNISNLLFTNFFSRINHTQDSQAHNMMNIYIWNMKDTKTSEETENNIKFHVKKIRKKNYKHLHFCCLFSGTREVPEFFNCCRRFLCAFFVHSWHLKWN